MDKVGKIEEAIKLRADIFRGKTREKEPSGSIAWRNGQQQLIMEANWVAELSYPGGTLFVNYTPPGRDEIVHETIKLKAANVKYKHGGISWSFFCNGKSKRCQKFPINLYLDKNNRFVCRMCANLNFGYNRCRRHQFDGLVKNPKKVAEMLSSPFVTPSTKFHLMDIARRIEKMEASRQKKLRKIARLSSQVRACESAKETFRLSEQPSTQPFAETNLPPELPLPPIE
jgi:hypothetical protein